MMFKDSIPALFTTYAGKSLLQKLAARKSRIANVRIPGAQGSANSLLQARFVSAILVRETAQTRSNTSEPTPVRII